MSGYGIFIRRWVIRIVVAVGFIIALQIATLAFPYPFFSHKGSFGYCTVYSDRELSAAFDSIMAEVHTRLKSVELYTPDKHSRIFVCHNRSLFSLFARLSPLNPHIQGFNLSVFGNSFVSVSRVDGIQRERGDWPPYSIIHGGLAHAITHEIIHEYIADEMGFIDNYRAAFMKKEGYVEYSAHRALCAADPAVTLSDKIEISENVNNWVPHDYVRRVYRATLAVEYLSEMKGYRFADIMHDSLSLEASYREMLAWHAGRQESFGPD